MFMNFRRIRKCQCVQLLTTGLLLCVVMVCWEELDHHVVSHMRSYTYRYLVNSYDFLNSSFAVTSNHPQRKEGSRTLSAARPSGTPGGMRALFGQNWMPNVRVLFALGVHPDAERRPSVQRALIQEDRVYGDLIQQNFLDTFHNLTAKLVLQFHWGHKYCPQARFLMSADDDIFVHMPNLVKYLQQQSGAKDLWVGHVHRGAPPVRRKESKYHVPEELYPWPSYPDYTAGAGYVVSADVATKIYHATLLLNSSMYIDDVFMGICAKAMGVSPQEHVYFSGEAKAPYHPCIYEHMITSHGHATDVRSLWQAATHPTVYRNSRGFIGNLYCKAVKVMLLCLPHYQSTYSCIAAFT
ncbi:Lactosylceramide 1,3-N-acetyl-beta-D-glucosaminyltransferase A [Larimichthys crocea]|uniref:Hexosyltransferase n=1 Tax=Larimichthys crocea TaxID=215358 RepID=A0A6G0IRD6_LARCR|nr:Lactosylceramide 1,3-N-acetyl-beta-D-glucosaminyltransferase A [Larimichthys crocea]